LIPKNSYVTLNVDKVDPYGRIVAEVMNDKGVNTNEKLTEEGLAVYYPFQKGCKTYESIQDKAKKDKKGVWADLKFENPWDYRKRMVSKIYLSKKINRIIFID
jgi:endonuclease YncB( thermonuclease family)